MAIKTKEEILASIKEKLGDDTSDEALTFIEDITDTLTDFESKTADSTDWEKKYKENDAEWRKKYKDRFFSTGNTETQKDDDTDLPINEDKKLTYDELFKEKEK